MSCSKMKVLRGYISLVTSTRLQPEDIGKVLTAYFIIMMVDAREEKRIKARMI